MADEGAKSTYTKTEIDALIAALNAAIAAIPTFDPFAQFLDIIPWVSLEGFDTGGSAGGEITIYNPVVTLVTPATTNSYKYLVAGGTYIKLYESPYLVTLQFIIASLLSVDDQNIWIRLDELCDVPPGEHGDHLGFKIINGRLWASNGDGSAQTITDTGIDLSVGEQWNRLKIVYHPGTDIKFYYNEVLVATHTTHLPTSDSPEFYIYIKSLAEAQKQISIGSFLLRKNYS